MNGLNEEPKWHGFLVYRLSAEQALLPQSNFLAISHKFPGFSQMVVNLNAAQEFIRTWRRTGGVECLQAALVR